MLHNHTCLSNCCRNGIEGLNDDLLTRGFAMNEEGGILKVPGCTQHSSVVYWVHCVRHVHEHTPAGYGLCQISDMHAHASPTVVSKASAFWFCAKCCQCSRQTLSSSLMPHDCTAYSCFLTVQLECIATYAIFGHDCTVHAVSLRCTCHILLLLVLASLDWPLLGKALPSA